MLTPKGKKFIVEIEITKECDFQDTCIANSIYNPNQEQRIIADTFVINRLHIQGWEEIKDKIKESVGRNLDQIFQ